MNRSWPTIISLSLLLLCPALPAGTESPTTAPAATPPSDVDIDLITVSAPPVGAPHDRIASGARSIDSARPFLFASSATGCTIEERPTFYWYLTQATDCDIEMDLVRMDGDVRTSVFKKLWEGVKDPGVYSFQATETDGKPLQLNTEYQVTVTLMLSKTQNAVSSGFVMRVKPPPGITADSDAIAFAKAGIWYDAIAAVSHKIDTDPADESARRQRRGLLWTEHVFSAVNREADPAAAQPAEADMLRAFAKNEGKPAGK